MPQQARCMYPRKVTLAKRYRLSFLYQRQAPLPPAMMGGIRGYEIFLESWQKPGENNPCLI